MSLNEYEKFRSAVEGSNEGKKVEQVMIRPVLGEWMVSFIYEDESFSDKRAPTKEKAVEMAKQHVPENKIIW